MPMIKIQLSSFQFEPNSLTRSLAMKLMKAINYAYMSSLPSTCKPYVPTDISERAAYMVACKTVLDNLQDVADSQDIINECLYTLKL